MRLTADWKIGLLGAALLVGGIGGIYNSYLKDKRRDERRESWQKTKDNVRGAVEAFRDRRDDSVAPAMTPASGGDAPTVSASRSEAAPAATAESERRTWGERARGAWAARKPTTPSSGGSD